ncbi:MAG: GTP-binding protein [Burkholderiaceae bacterium]
MPNPKPVPVTVIGGYLGAGKTTLINELLSGNHGRRITIVVNDFGAINVDASLIVARDGNTISLANGCICCSIAGDLTTELRRLASSEPVPEQIIVEASGVADPAKVSNAVRGWSSMHLLRTVTLFDPQSLARLSEDKFAGSTVKRQLRNAQTLFPSKLDILDSDTLSQALQLLHRIVPGSAVLVGPFSRGEQITQLLDLETEQTEPTRLNNESTTLQSVLPQGVSHASMQFANFAWYPDGPVNEICLRAAFQTLGSRLQRCKGWVQLATQPITCALVQHGPSDTEIAAIDSLPHEQAQLLLIYARDQCDESALRALLQGCLSRPDH